jgi:hypothetical protein
MHPVAQSREVWLRFHGLPFARWDDGRVFFGISDAREELSAGSRFALKRQVNDLEVHRHPLATDTRHSLYRAQAERWMESIVREGVTRVDAALDQRFVYTQVFANAGGEHGILDLLTVTRSGRLAIIELKASEHIHLPLQGGGLLAARPAPFGEWGNHAVRVFSRFGITTGAAAGLSGCASVAISSVYR